VAMSGKTYGRGEKEGEVMENKHVGLEKAWNGIGWGLLIILAGVLMLSGNKGWVEEGAGWLYFIIGMGAIFIISFFVQFYGSRGNTANAFSNLAVGIGLAYIGTAFLYGFGDWWPLVFIPFGFAIIAKSIWRSNSRANAR
jgi:hypothetical protein